LFKLILSYANNTPIETNNLLLEIAFEPIKLQMDRDKEKWDSIKEKRKHAGSLGGQAKVASASKAKQKVAKGSKGKQCLANVAVNVNDTVNVTVTDTVTDNDIVNETEEEKKCEKASFPPCPHNAILDIWRNTMPEKRQPRLWDGANKANLKSRWMAGFKIKHPETNQPIYTDLETGLEFWRIFIEWTRESDFLMNKCKPFGIDWIVKKENFTKIFNENFH
jgi:hypothetical protein